MSTRYAGLIQPILIQRGATHEDSVVAAARASVLAWINSSDQDTWTPWLAGSFAKTVRRVRPIEGAKAAHLMAARVEVGTAVAWAAAPVASTAMPAEIRKGQVEGTDFDRTGAFCLATGSRGDLARPDVPVVVINQDVEMSTGKTAAQVAHGLFGWAVQQRQEGLDAWVAGGAEFEVVEVLGSEFSRVEASVGRGGVVIADAGFTEVVPGTKTVATLNPLDGMYAIG